MISAKVNRKYVTFKDIYFSILKEWNVIYAMLL